MEKIDYEFLSDCSHEEWLSNQHSVVTSDFVPLKKREDLFVESYNILSAMKARVWIANGTLLGAVREGDFIISDDDIDMDIAIDLLNKPKKKK